MLLKYDVKRLDSVIRDFYNVTGITVCVLDADFNSLALYPKGATDFCSLIQTTPEGWQRCFESDRNLLAQTLEKKCACTHCCHAGLADTMVPIYNKNSLIGFLMFGQVRRQGVCFSEVFENIRTFMPNALQAEQAYNRLMYFDPERLESAAGIVTILTKYILLEQMIQSDGDDTLDEITAYIDRNPEQKLSVAELCRKFHISRNALYSAFQNRLGCGVREYVNERRLACAERLLRTTDLPVYMICERCGIENYQYFCRRFKQKKGLTPLRYRKKWLGEQKEKYCIREGELSDGFGES